MFVNYRVVAIGASAGGMNALARILSSLPPGFTPSVVVVLHVLEEGMDGYRTHYLNKKCALPVKEAMDKEPLQPGTVYLAPAAYHLLLEETGSLSLSVDAPVNFSRPSIDVMFESAAAAHGEKLLGIILTGANNDGSQGIKKIKEFGGYTLAQDPEEAEAPAMPRAAIEGGDIDQILTLVQIGHFLNMIVDRTGKKTPTSPSTRNNIRADTNECQ